MFKNALVYRLDPWEASDPAEMERLLDAASFVECTPTQRLSVGWVAPRGAKHGALVENVGHQLVLKLCTETKAVPGAVVRAQLDERLEAIEAETGRRPKGRAVREIKEQIEHDLLPRAFPKRSTTLVWIDREACRVVVDAGSAKHADAVTTRLVELLPGLRLAPWQAALAPATAMAAWLSEKEAPPGFSIDRDCELKQPDSEKAAVRYARHTLDIDEVGVHIAQGKLPTQLALTWNGRVSFVLTDALALKRIKLLDVKVEAGGAADGDDDGFDADVALATGELRRLLPDLVDALGGPATTDAAEPSGRHAPDATDAAPFDRLAA